SLDLSTLAELLRSPLFAQTLGFTVWQATLSTLLTLLVALPAAHVFAKYTFPGKAFLQALTTIPFVMPAVVVAAAFAATLGPRGWLNQLLMALFHREQPLLNLQHTLWIILLAHVFYNYTVILRMVGGFWANLGPRLEEAARALGADHWHTFGEVTLPLLRPAILAAALLVFIFDFTSFGVILILGGPRFATLEVEIYQQTVNLFNLPLAAALSLTQIGFTFISMWLYTHLQAASSVPLPLRAQRLVQRRPQTAREIAWVAANIGFMVVLLLTPLLALVERSLLGRDGYGVDHYLALFTNPRGSILFVPPLEAVRNSLLVAAATVALAVGLGLLAADLLTQRKGVIRATLDPIFMLPLGTSAVTLGFGYILALDEPPLNLRASPLLLPLAHGLVAFPFVVRSLLPVLRSIHPHLREAAAVLGASPGRVWREIDLPIVSPALLVGSVFAFTISLGEFGATSLIARPEFPTMPVAIFRFLGQPGALNYGQALAMSSLLMLVCSLGILAIERFRSGEKGEF
ncbi:MAG: iron ABC transporter permease, partial [Chloroflexi bacterium]|nr:iron ABC transporter permease [Chloroflexota bacterium]